MLYFTALPADLRRFIHAVLIAPALWCSKGAQARARWLLLLGVCGALAACGTSLSRDEITGMRVVPTSKTAAAATPQKAAVPSTTVRDWSCNEVSELPEAPQAQRMASAVAPVVAPSGQARSAADALSIVYFDFDQSVIREEFVPVLEAHARHLLADSSRQVVLEGHCDERGSTEYNIALGQRRSEAVRRALLQLGVKDAQIETISFGEEKPAVSEQNEEAYAKNRRVEFSYR